jgi:hypothetical protein
MPELLDITDPRSMSPSTDVVELDQPAAAAAPPTEKPNRKLTLLRRVDSLTLAAAEVLTVALLGRVGLQAFWASDRSGFVAWVGRITFPLVPLRGALPDVLLFGAYQIETDTLVTLGLYLLAWMGLQRLLAPVIRRAQPPPAF